MSLSKRDFFDQPLRNVGSETIPAFAIVEVKSPGLVSFAGKEWFTVGKPTSQGKVYFVNGPFPIPASGTGGGASPYRSPGVHALHDPAMNPATNETLSATADQWHLSAGAGFVVLGDPKGSPASQPGFPASASTLRVRVVITPVSTTEPVFAILIADVPAARLTETSITPGYAEEAANLCNWSLSGVSDALAKDGATMPALNPFWQTIIKASTSSPVIAHGRTQLRNVYETGNPQKKLVFVIESLAYPITIVSGRVSSAVAGGDWIQSVERTLWGRGPAETHINVKNPDGWTGPAQGYAVAMRLTDGTWWGIDLKCV